ncbi:MAG: dihydrolipoyl dehydrogenase, partial [Proteobacteria bacterium]|nr:dihydrolipoyl dehydrogenase [Pseudomonadota bacterium]
MHRYIEVRVPDLGDFDEVEIIDVLVKKGDSVKLDDPLITLESDKATMDIPSSAAGEIKDVKVSVGERVAVGTLIVLLASATTSDNTSDNTSQ